MENVNITPEFLTAGRAIFTVARTDTNQHYTYKITEPDTQRDPKNPIYFVSFLSGPDNETDYTYLGLLRMPQGIVVQTVKSGAKATETIFKVANWAIKLVLKGDAPPENYKISHCGTCGRCGRTLTHPESLETGLGPVCAEKGV